ncbi:ribonuclease H family protein, partial [Klebsiella pneumoniae]|uniref:ribonuclease H family protein n=1 Tax=Klebsiella pneumoniae TaxID=573 RepID=UPI00405579D0
SNSLQPSTPDEMRTFLGKVTYYHSFIPSLSTITAPLRAMVQSSNFKWTEEATSSYNHLKNELISDRVLTPYDPNLPLILATDASPVGLGAVLSHIMPELSSIGSLRIG